MTTFSVRLDAVMSSRKFILEIKFADYPTTVNVVNQIEYHALITSTST